MVDVFDDGCHNELPCAGANSLPHRFGRGGFMRWSM